MACLGIELAGVRLELRVDGERCGGADEIEADGAGEDRSCVDVEYGYGEIVFCRHGAEMTCDRCEKRPIVSACALGLHCLEQVMKRRRARVLGKSLCL